MRKTNGRVRKGPEVKQKLLGPLTFSIDRLVAIFESITGRNERNSSLLSQLRTLVKLKLIHIGKLYKLYSTTCTRFKFILLQDQLFL
jgi:hypothetical protein